MKRDFVKGSVVGAVALCLVGAATAEETFTDGVDIYDIDAGQADLYVLGASVLDDNVCVGTACVETETFGNPVLRLKDVVTSIEFFDSSGTSLPDRDWKLRVNDPLSGGIERFSIEDLTENTIPFTVEGGGPNHALWIETVTGDIGFGTQLPQKELHVVDGTTPTLRLEQGTASGFPNQVWDIFASHLGFGVMDITTGRGPFVIQTGAPGTSIQVKSDGDIGLGTGNPDGKLHTKGDGVQLVYFESGDGGPVQVRFRTDSENRRFLAVNNADQVKSQLVFGDSEIKLTGATDSGANLWLSVGPAGIVTRGPTCNPGPCDAVFDPEVFTPLPIEDHAAAMWENRYLGAVGPTGPDRPVNLAEKLGGVIHELEVAHIYIEELHATNKSQELRIAAQDTRHAEQEAAHAEQIAALLARVEALESALQAE